MTGRHPPAASTAWFPRFSRWVSLHAGRPASFAVAVLIVVLWAASGPYFGFGDTWQLVINTGTTVITFLMVFLIQGTQNRESQAIQAKLDELIAAGAGAHNEMLDLEEMDEDELDSIHRHYLKLAESARRARLGRAENSDGSGSG